MLTLGNAPLGLDALRTAYAGPLPVALGRDGLERAQASAAALARLVTHDEPAYGINTGFGLLANTRIAREQQSKLQENLVLSHAAGVGEPLPDAVVRLALLLKLASLLQGQSGISRPVLDFLAALVNARAWPVVPAQGSVGASGDLAPLAHLALPLMGRGQLRLDGQVLPADQALARLGLRPIALGPKEGLALLNGTQVSTALALAALFETEAAALAAVVTGALSVDALRGSDAPFDARIQAVRGHAGQIRVAASFRRLLAGSGIRESHRDCPRVQDPYSLRCQPQVMGACLDLLEQAAGTLRIEANAVTDNPLIFGDEVLSGGNFHAEPVAFAADQLALAAAEVGSLAERRIALLVDPKMSGLPAFLVADSGVNSGFMIAQVTAAALVAENRMMAHPASVDSIPTSANQEDHVSMATHGARRSLAMASNLQQVIAIELLAACQGIDFHRPLSTSPSLAQAHAGLRREVPFLDADRLMADDIAAALRVLRSDAVQGLAPELRLTAGQA